MRIAGRTPIEFGCARLRALPGPGYARHVTSSPKVRAGGFTPSGETASVAGGQQTRRIYFFVLLIVYIVSVVLHIAVLWRASQFPHISSDETQYVATAENILRGRGYTIRGHFNESLPPLFPLFVAAAHVSFTEARAAAFVASCVVMALAIFPVFAISQKLGVAPFPSVLAASAASFLPHTFYSATYMAEVLQYPAFMTAVYLALLWIEKQTTMRALMVGNAAGVLMLIKVQGLHFAGALLIAMIWLCASKAWSAGRNGAPFGQALLIVLSFIMVAGSWAVYKQFHGAGAMGMYGRVLQQQGLPHLHLSLVAAYCSDFLLSPGLITASLAIVFLKRERRRVWTVFLGSLFLIECLAVAVIDGGLTGWLRERLFFYSLPLMSVCAIAAARTIGMDRRRFYALLTLPSLLLLGGLLLHPFHVSPVAETPWATLLGSWTPLHPGQFSKWTLFVTGTAAILMLGLLLSLVGVRRRPSALAGAILALNLCALLWTSRALAGWTDRGLAEIRPILELLRTNQVSAGQRLLVAGRDNYFEPPSDQKDDPLLLEWNWRLGLSEAVVWSIETLGRLDIRMIGSEAELASSAIPGDRLLSTASFSGIADAGQNPPFRLYRISAVPVRSSASLITRLTEDRFQALAGGLNWREIGTRQVLNGPFLRLPSGVYRATFNVRGREEADALLDFM